MRIIFSIIFILNIYTFSQSQIYQFINSQLHKKSSYLPENYYLEHPQPNPFSGNIFPELAIPDSIITIITVTNHKDSTIKTIFNDWLDQGLYTIRWNGTDEEGKITHGGIFKITVNCIKNGIVQFSDSSLIMTPDFSYSTKTNISQRYFEENRFYGYHLKYLGNGLIDTVDSKIIQKNFDITFTKVTIDTSTNSTINIEGVVYSDNLQNRISNLDVIITDADIKYFIKGKLPLSQGTITDKQGRFRIFTVNFPTTKVYFLHKGFVIQYFNVGQLSTLYKNNPAMYEKTIKAYKSRYNIAH